MDLKEIINFTKIIQEDMEKHEEKMELYDLYVKNQSNLPSRKEFIEMAKSIDYNNIVEFGKVPTEEEKQSRIQFKTKINWSNRMFGIIDNSFLPLILFTHNNSIFNGFLEKVIEEFGSQIEQVKPKMVLRDHIRESIIHFLNKVLTKEKSGHLTKELEQEYATIFLNEIQMKSFREITIIELLGINFKDSIVKISDEICLKKGEKSDYYDFEKFASLTYTLETHLPYVILMTDNNGSSRFRELHNDVAIPTFIRLFTLNPLYVGKIHTLKYSMISSHMIDEKEISKIRPEKNYELNDVNLFKNFLNRLIKIHKKNSNTSKYKLIQIALERYNWALREELQIDRKLMFAVMGLEPLLHPEVSGGKGGTLGYRLSTLFSILKCNTKDVIDTVERAYKMRNYIVHGKDYPDSWKDEMKEIYPKILRYLRNSILIFLLNIGQKRDTFISLINDSKNDKQAKAKLEKYVKKLSTFVQPDTIN